MRIFVSVVRQISILRIALYITLMRIFVSVVRQISILRIALYITLR
jgi:hypothetical protein